MLKNVRRAMLRLTKLGKPCHKRWCTAIVLVAVCTLAFSVTTRYSFLAGPPSETRTVVQNPHSLAPKLQRLLNDAATWIPPLVESSVLHDPGYYPHVTPSDAPVLGVLLERNLYNRPPPSHSLS